MLVVGEDCGDQVECHRLRNRSSECFLDQVSDVGFGLVLVALFHGRYEQLNHRSLELFVDFGEAFINVVFQNLISSHGKTQRYQRLCQHTSSWKPR